MPGHPPAPCWTRDTSPTRSRHSACAAAYRGAEQHGRGEPHGRIRTNTRPAHPGCPASSLTIILSCGTSGSALLPRRPYSKQSTPSGFITHHARSSRNNLERVQRPRRLPGRGLCPHQEHSLENPGLLHRRRVQRAPPSTHKTEHVDTTAPEHPSRAMQNNAIGKSSHQPAHLVFTA